jgi:hypothetical protein
MVVFTVVRTSSERALPACNPVNSARPASSGRPLAAHLRLQGVVTLPARPATVTAFTAR